jgi:hypothetical protein
VSCGVVIPSPPAPAPDFDPVTQAPSSRARDPSPELAAVLDGAVRPEHVELLLGCGRDRARRFPLEGRHDFGPHLVTLDHNADHEPDIVWDLEQLPLPFHDDTFTELHAYEVLEHTGHQGDWRFFFAQFSEFWRILRPGGYLAATCPSWRSMWAWGDPSHTRVLTSGSLVFLSQEQYRIQVDGKGPRGDAGRTPMSDFRHVYQADFEIARDETGRPLCMEDDERFVFVLRAIKGRAP